MESTIYSKLNTISNRAITNSREIKSLDQQPTYDFIKHISISTLAMNAIPITCISCRYLISYTIYICDSWFTKQTIYWTYTKHISSYVYRYKYYMLMMVKLCFLYMYIYINISYISKKLQQVKAIDLLIQEYSNWGEQINYWKNKSSVSGYTFKRALPDGI